MAKILPLETTMPLSVLDSAEREAGSGGWRLGEHHWKHLFLSLFCCCFVCSVVQVQITLI